VTYWNLMDDLVDLLELYLRYHPAPLRVLTDPAYEPTAEEIDPMLSALHPRGDPGVRIDGGESVPEAERRCVRFDEIERTILSAGGWPHIAKTVSDYRDNCPREWKLLGAHVRWIRPGGVFRNGDGGRLSGIAERLGLNQETVIRRRREIVQEMARNCLMESKDGFRLVG
jgi:hypothetical protein